MQATLGARLHRDGIWVIHAAAALAVFAAVAVVDPASLLPCSTASAGRATEFVALAFIALIVLARPGEPPARMVDRDEVRGGAAPQSPVCACRCWWPPAVLDSPNRGRPR